MAAGILIVAVMMAVGNLVADSQQMADGTNAVATVDIQAYLELKAENDALRRENQMLRRELVAGKGAMLDSLLPEKAVEPDAKPEPQFEDTGYWLSAKSKIRHNRRCRNYRKVKGNPCGSTDGRPCKICGG